MNERTKRINEAIRNAKKRDNYRCRICGQGTPNMVHVHGAHLLPRNVPFPGYDPANMDFIVTLCAHHHRAFDLFHAPVMKARWMLGQGQRDLAEIICNVSGTDMEQAAGKAS